MATSLPLITRHEIVREYRLDQSLTLDSGIRALRAKKVLSNGISVTLRGEGGTVAGRTHLYSALNRDAARATRRGELDAAQRICVAASRLERSREMQTIAAGLSHVTLIGNGAVGSNVLAAVQAAALARALSVPTLAPTATALDRKTSRARRDLKLSFDPTVLTGHVHAMDHLQGLLKLHGSVDVHVPKVMLELAALDRIGAAVSAMWEVLPGGQTLLTVEPAVETGDEAELDEALVDLYGTPWGGVLAGTDPDTLRRTGVPTIDIPAGIPDIE